jgi:hypothetical protein
MTNWFRRPAATIAIAADDVGFTVLRSDQTEPTLVRWDDIDKIETLKLKAKDRVSTRMVRRFP